MEICKVLMIGNEPIKNMGYTIVLSTGDKINGQTDEEGKLSHGDLIPGRYTIEIGEQADE